jgi:raffinose/stachyose/melibiose transport system permease protein
MWLILVYAGLFLLVLFVGVPLYISVLGGAKEMGQLMSQPMNVPHPLMINQYTDILTAKVGNFWRSLMNSSIVAVLSVAFGLVVCAAAGFALARLNFKLKSLIYNYFLIGILFPLAVSILPLYLQLRSLKLIDHYLGVVLPQVAFGVPVQVLLLTQFFKAIPKELEDACEIDGYGPIGFFWYTVIPLSTPILATVSVLILVGSWNSFFLPLLVFNNNKLFTLPMGVMDFMGEHMTGWNQILGFLTLAMIPAVLFFIFMQKYIVAGLTGGAIKG